ncbi:MAG: hypothetical protein QOH60_1289 [Mycobacterium sp.]|jgi:methyltransferase (TIGR00027 family)|nr:hypothetical protein [Mycobacterium sp.]
MRWPPLRRLTISAGERVVPGSWAVVAGRKRYIDDKLAEALESIDAVVVLGAGMDTRAYQLSRRSDIPVFEVDLSVNIERKKDVLRRVFDVLPRSVHLVPLDFERDDLLGALTQHGYSAGARTFFVWEGVTQYLTEDAVRATFTALRGVPSGSRLVLTYVRKEFIDGLNMYGATLLYKRFRQRRKVWKFGMRPEDVADFLEGFGWRMIEQAGPEYMSEHYIRPAQRDIAASELEWFVYAEKP